MHPRTIRVRPVAAISLACLVVTLAQGSRAQAQVGTRSQTFDTDPGWSSQGSGVGGNSFGYSPTANAGGTVGEAGGRVTRSNSFRYYADTHLGGNLRLNQPISASGKFDFTSASTPDFVNGLFIGHFSSGAENYAMGIFFSNGGSNSSKLAWGINVRGDGNNILTPQTSLDPNIDRTWSTTWDPAGGVNGMGRLTAMLSGPGGGTKFVDMPNSTLVRPNATFDSFGLMATNVLATPQSSFFADIYVDNLAYSVPIPEPHRGLILIGIVSLFWYRGCVRS